MNTQFSSKPKSETILVAKAGVPIANVANATENLFDPTTLVANILNGQIGIVCDTHTSSTRKYNEYLNTTDDAVKVDEIRIVQGTPNSADISKVAPLPYGHKEAIKSFKVKAKNGILYTAKVAKASSNDAWVIGGPTTGAIQAVSDSDYKLNLQFISKRNDRDFSISGNENLSVSYSTPDYVTLATAEPLDHLVKNLVYNSNLNSYGLRFNIPSFVRRGNKNFVSFAINFAGGSGVALSSITAGTPFPVLVSNGQNINFIPDADFVKTIANIIANGASYGVTGASTIELVDLTTAGTADEAQGILLVSLDHQLAAARDEIPQVKVRLNVGLEYGFNGVNTTKVNLSKPYEGEGKGRVWQLEYNNRARLNVFTQQNRMYGEYFLEVPSYIDETLHYTAYIIEHKDEYQVAYSHDSEYFHRLIILVPCTESSPGVFVSDATVVSGLNTYLGQWLTSVRTLGKLETSTPPATPFFV